MINYTIGAINQFSIAMYTIGACFSEPEELYLPLAEYDANVIVCYF